MRNFMEYKHVAFAWICLFLLLFAANSVTAQEEFTAPNFAQKPVVCGPEESLIAMMEENDLYPLIASPAKTIVDIQNGKPIFVPVVVIVFVSESGKMMIVEHLVNAEDRPMCQLSVGEGIEFDTQAIKDLLGMQ